MAKESLDFDPVEALVFQEANRAKDLSIKEIRRLNAEAERLQKELEQIRKAAKELQDQNAESYNGAVTFILTRHNKTLPTNRQVAVILNDAGKPIKLEWES